MSEEGATLGTEILINYLHKKEPAIDKDDKLAIAPREGGQFQLVDKVSGLPHYDSNGRTYLFTFNQIMGKGEDTVSDLMKEANHLQMQREVKRNQTIERAKRTGRTLKYISARDR